MTVTATTTTMRTTWHGLRIRWCWYICCHQCGSSCACARGGCGSSSQPVWHVTHQLEQSSVRRRYWSPTPLPLLFGCHDRFVVSVTGTVLPPSSSFILYNGRYSGIQERRSHLVVCDMIMDETTVVSLKSFDWLVSSSIYFVAISTVLLLFDWWILLYQNIQYSYFSTMCVDLNKTMNGKNGTILNLSKRKFYRYFFNPICGIIIHIECFASPSKS